MSILDRTDRAILSALQEDGRLSVTDLAERVNLSHTPCLRRVKRLETQGVIRGYAAMVDQQAVGLPVSVFVSVTLERQAEAELDQFEAAIRACPEVMECFLMTGGSDFLLRVVAADLQAYELFLKRALTRIPGIRAIQSSFALKQVVGRAALPLANHDQ
ncbi:Lrp/AsnC family transcriptional regulator [Niveispirillum sp.]|uniref:Lrp/AsnC family transcriptional regulator n=1 Tax=Niveispirillum sp. TaxID=1917217 RepID=UPI001B4A08F5|nr:Lrp/AsnC family transcriptional regulator [Niveispirillum sp.]MBP7336720.1 Lrp/AsnC family transcriptional regulator [Niveispirillum sp.]